ncbi:MAG TPA: SDR family oxidoreductase [Alphaproteobacteria bacterium]|jgi:NAD(P)-dependent dehydrogenase (short-subunit alcohol dehydrogenase family)
MGGGSAADAGLAGKAVIVTGAASGMGAAMARALVARGALVAGVDVNAAGLAALQGELAKGPGRFLPLTADAGRLPACEAAVVATLDAFGRLDALVNNAGVGMTAARPKAHKGPLRFWEAEPDGWLRIMATNCNAAYFMARTATPHLLKAGRGRIVNVTTNMQTMLKEGRCAYGPSKAAFEAGSAIWAKELQGSGVTVNVLIPGGQTNTNIFPAELSRDGMLHADIMVPPLLWLLSNASDDTNGWRFAAEDWNDALPPGEAALAARMPAAWPDYTGRPASAAMAALSD